MPTSGLGAPAHVSVTTRRKSVPFADPLSAYLALQPVFGASNVYLLESLAGPESDRRSAAVGFQPLLEISVSRGAVTITGAERLVALATDAGTRADALVGAGGSLRLSDDGALWAFIRAVQAGFDRGAGELAPGLGFLAFFGYDAVHYIEKLPYLIDAADGPPDVTLVLYQGSVVFDLRDSTAQIVVHDSQAWAPLDPDTLAVALADAAKPSPQPLPEVPEPRSVVDSTTEAEFVTNVEKCLNHIALGDIYQVQIGHELMVGSDVDELTVYRRLRSRNPSPYMCLLPVAGHTVIGSSPELFVRISDDAITMRPIAGTAPRGADPVENEARVAVLREDEKEIAEHVMLVDLCRNDLGRVCQTDTVTVDEMMVVEDFSHVFHLVSNVSGRLDPDIDAYDILAATFPAGTMTGAPKIRAMEIIEDTETSRRGLYAGAFGMIDFTGDMVLALSIRTVFSDGRTYRTRASAGVVADSVPSREWRETLAKMSAAFWAVAGRELL